MISQYLKIGKYSLSLAALVAGSTLNVHAGAGAAGGAAGGARAGGAAAGGARAGGAAAGGGGARGTAASGYAAPGTIGTANIMVDPETRQIVVVGSHDVIQQIQNVVDSLDAPKPQVLIKVVFLDVTYNKNLDIGIEGSYGNNRLGNDSNPLNGLFTNGFGMLAQGVGGAAPGGLYRILAQDFTATVRAAEQNGNLKVLSRPSILARNNQLAIIQVGASVPIPQASQVGANGQITTTIAYQPVGIILRVTPFITRDGQIEMIVAPEVSSIDPSAPIAVSQGVNAPILRQTYAETVVVTQDRVPVVIGGLVQNDKSDVVDKVPLLGDIPLFGGLFRHTVKKDTQHELIIILFPTIVHDPNELGIISEEEASASLLNPEKKRFTTKELEDVFDSLPNVRPAAPKR